MTEAIAHCDAQSRRKDPTSLRPTATCDAPSVQYVPQAQDTNEATDRMVFEGLRRLTPLERLQIASRASAALHRLSVAGLRLRFPQANAEELGRRAGALRLGPALSRAALGEAADALLE